MKLNLDKCHLTLNVKELTTFKIGNLRTKIPLRQKLLGINFDYKLNFTKPFENLCQKASRKLNGLASLAPFMTSSKIRALVNASFKSQFNYYP